MPNDQSTPQTSSQLSSARQDISSPPKPSTSFSTQLLPKTTPPSLVPTKYGGKWGVATIFALGFFLVGVISTIILVQRQQLIPSRAADCSKYVFEVTQDGVVKAQNGGTIPIQSQKATVYINDILVTSFDVPTLSGGQAASLGRITPLSGEFRWRIEGTIQCQNEGAYGVPMHP